MKTMKHYIAVVDVVRGLKDDLWAVRGPRIDTEAVGGCRTTTGVDGTRSQK